jgi:hypothetical protein
MIVDAARRCTCPDAARGRIGGAPETDCRDQGLWRGCGPEGPWLVAIDRGSWALPPAGGVMVGNFLRVPRPSWATVLRGGRLFRFLTSLLNVGPAFSCLRWQTNPPKHQSISSLGPASTISMTLPLPAFHEGIILLNGSNPSRRRAWPNNLMALADSVLPLSSPGV